MYIPTYLEVLSSAATLLPADLIDRFSKAAKQTPIDKRIRYEMLSLQDVTREEQFSRLLNTRINWANTAEHAQFWCAVYLAVDDYFVADRERSSERMLAMLDEGLSCSGNQHFTIETWNEISRTRYYSYHQCLRIINEIMGNPVDLPALEDVNVIYSLNL